MKMKRLTYWDESRALAALDQALGESPLRVFSKVRLLDVIGPDRDEQLSREDRNFLMTSHLDFVVCERGTFPVFAVEFDGPQHMREPQRTRDVRKNRLCTAAKLPLLRVRRPQIEEHERSTVLEFMVRRFVAWRHKERGIRHEVQRRMEAMSDVQLRSLTEDYLDPSLDPSVLFDIAHPFPGIRTLAERLLSDYKMRTPFVSMRRVREAGWLPLVCDIEPQGDEGGSQWDTTKLTRYAVYRVDPGTSCIEAHYGRVISDGIHLLVEGTVRFGMHWILPVAEDYDPGREAPFDYFSRTRKTPIAFSGLPGASIPDVAESVSEYLALREVERWAARTLCRTRVAGEDAPTPS